MEVIVNLEMSALLEIEQQSMLGATDPNRPRSIQAFGEIREFQEDNTSVYIRKATEEEIDKNLAFMRLIQHFHDQEWEEE